MRRNREECITEGCTRDRARAGGLCRTCWARTHKCANGCNVQPYSRNLCRKCWLEFKVEEGPKCVSFACTSAIHKDGLCKKHWEKGRPPNKEASPPIFTFPTLDLRPWMKEAACKDVADPDIFFPEQGQWKKGIAAKAICAGCPVKKDCLDYAIEYEQGDRYGIWGGMNTKERWEHERELKRRSA